LFIQEEVMAQRRFGPTQGAGVVVVEKDAEKILDPAALGVVLYVGILEKGQTGKLISTSSPKNMRRKIGHRIPESAVADAAEDFWQHSDGAGEVHFLRVTDGTERKAASYLYSRETVARRVAKLEASSGGRWGSRYQVKAGAATGASDFTETTLTTGLTMLVNDWVGAKLTLDGVNGKSYEVISNDIAGILTVKSDSKMKTDLAAATDFGWVLLLDRDTSREVTYEIGDGTIDSANEWSLKIYVNGDLVRSYADLSMDPAAKRYFVRMINDDPSNEDVVATDLNAPASVSPAKRPANTAGTISAVTKSTLTGTLFTTDITSPTGGNATVALGAHTDAHQYRDRIELTFSSATAFTAKSLDLMGGASLGTAGTLGTAFTPNTPLLPPFTPTAGGTPMVSGDKIVIEYTPFRPGALVGALVYPDFVNAPLKAFRITGNTHAVITIQNGDLTADGAVSDQFRVEWAQPLGGSQGVGGYDGISAVVDANYMTPHLDATPRTGSKARQLIGQNKGLVKVGCPGVTATAVQKAGLAFAEAMNWQFRVEMPASITDEPAAITYINNTIGRNDMGVTSLPSYGYVVDPLKPGQLKLQTLTGMIHGVETLVAKNFDGYHKAAAGTDVVLPKVQQLPLGVEDLNEEMLNPAGVNVVKKVKGNFILWGDRSIALDPAWKFKHQREQMSHYENVLRENFDYIVFAINNLSTRASLKTTLNAFFGTEFAKGSLGADRPQDAFTVKIDSDNNASTDAANGDLICDIDIALANTVERFVMRVGKKGIFEQQS
jgi:hypothetical protein